MSKNQKKGIVRYRDKTENVSCPYGQVERIVTGGEGGIANVHVVTVSKGNKHYHNSYDEVYYILSGHGTISLNEETHSLTPGAVVVIPAGVPHALSAEPGEELEFIIFGTPPVSIDSPEAAPRN